MTNDTDLVARLRRELDEHRASLAVPSGLLAAARDRSRRRRARSALLAAALVAVAAGLGATAALALVDGETTVTAGTGPPDPSERAPEPTDPPPPAPVTSTTFPTGPPSQTPEAAALTGVRPEVAALPFAARVQELARIEDGMETWILSRAPEVAWQMAGDDGCFGDVAGEYGADYVCPTEYAEVLLLGSGVPIVGAYPMPGLVPSWIHLTDEAVYAGRLGDGGLPWSSLVRIDRATLAAEVVVFQTPPDIAEPLEVSLPGWRDATPEEAERYGDLVTYGPDAVGTLVTTSWGPDGRIGVDIAGVEALFAGS